MCIHNSITRNNNKTQYKLQVIERSDHYIILCARILAFTDCKPRPSPSQNLNIIHNRVIASASTDPSPHGC